MVRCAEVASNNKTAAGVRLPGFQNRTSRPARARHGRLRKPWTPIELSTTGTATTAIMAALAPRAVTLPGPGGRRLEGDAQADDGPEGAGEGQGR